MSPSYQQYQIVESNAPQPNQHPRNTYQPFLSLCLSFSRVFLGQWCAPKGETSFDPNPLPSYPKHPLTTPSCWYALWRKPGKRVVRKGSPRFFVGPHLEANPQTQRRAGGASASLPPPGPAPPPHAPPSAGTGCLQLARPKAV